MKRIGALTALLVLFAACGGDSTGPSNSDNTGSAFDVTISSGTKPTYTWSGGNAQSVSVVRVSAPGTIVWGIANLSLNITSPVTHGTVQAGSLATANVEPTLTAGVKYRVAVTRADMKSGFKEFTP